MHFVIASLILFSFNPRELALARVNEEGMNGVLSDLHRRPVKSFGQCVEGAAVEFMQINEHRA